MSEHRILIERPEVQNHLLNSSQNHTQQPQPRQEQEESQNNTDHGRDLDKVVRKIETFLTFFGFNQCSVPSFVISWLVFVILGLSLPITILEIPGCSGCDDYQISSFELNIVGSQACLAAVSLICLSHNLRKYGLRKFLFVDQHSGHVTRFAHLYIQQIKNSLRFLVFWSLPIFVLKVVREVIRISYADESWLLSAAILFGLILSWMYVSTISLSASILFHIVCNLQVIHFDDYAKLLERESDVLLFIEEHIRLRYHLSKISHRFRIFLLLQFCIVTASQSIALFQTTGYDGKITIINGGDFAVSSIVQVVGIILCLHAATKISHRAQGISSIASRWHALATCGFRGSADASQMRVSHSISNLDLVHPLNSIQIDYSESDLDSVDYTPLPVNMPYVSSYHKRQAFVTYLQMNPGGITVFGWTIDRTLINSIFFIELSLVTFVLGKTIVSN